MAEDALETALKRKEALLRELAEIEDFIRLWHKFAGTEAEQQVSLPLDQTQRTQRSPRITQFAAPIKRSPPLAVMADLAHSLILDHGKPMTRGELVKEFERNNIAIGGKNQRRNMGTIMWRLREHFVNLEGHGYWPRGIAYSPAKYVPS